MMGGEIAVESDLGHGSRFTIRIPATLSQPRATTAPEPQAPLYPTSASAS